MKRFRRGFVLSYGMHHDDFDRALARHHGRIFTFATYLLSSRIEAEDITQEVFVKLWRSGDSIPPARIGAWLLRVTRNACFDQLRRRRWQRRRFTADPAGDPLTETASGAPGPEVLAAASELGRRLKIQRIRVQVGSIAGRDESSIHATIDGAVERLENSGWYRMITVRDEEESVYVLALERDGLLRGLSVFVHDGEEEVVLVNIAGDMDPELIGSLIRNVEQLEGVRDDIGKGLPEP